MVRLELTFVLGLMQGIGLCLHLGLKLVRVMVRARVKVRF
jgi:hypothetical protein